MNWGERERKRGRKPAGERRGGKAWAQGLKRHPLPPRDGAKTLKMWSVLQEGWFYKVKDRRRILIIICGGFWRAGALLRMKNEPGGRVRPSPNNRGAAVRVAYVRESSPVFVSPRRSSSVLVVSRQSSSYWFSLTFASISVSVKTKLRRFLT